MDMKNEIRIRNINERVAGIEPASLAWKARGYSRRRLTPLIQNRT